MKKRVLLILSCLFLSIGFVIAQTTKASGVVLDDAGETVPGVSVVVKGTTTGTITDGDGKFSLNVPAGNKILVFSLLGMQKVEANAAEGMRVTLQPDEATVLDDVVVTAMGITRAEKGLGYSVSVVDSDELTKAREGNILNSLSGKVAGVNILQSSGTAGGSSRIVIRGQSSLNSAGQPMFVIDGVPVSNSSLNLGINGGVDNGSRIGDISSDDIAEMSVLKGAAATALYGSRAKDGVIVITTKKGSKNSKASISFNSSLRVENPLVLPNYQNEYGPGVGTTGAYSIGAWNGWGPRISDVQDQKYPIFTGESVTLQAYKDNVKDYFETGKALTNSISISGGDAKSDYRIGVSALNQTGIIPENSYDRYNFTFNGGREFNEYLSSRVSVSYIKSTSEGRPSQGSNDTNVTIGTVLGMPRTMNTQWLKDNWITEDGKPYSLGQGVGNVNNPYWVSNKNKYTSDLDRVIASFTLTYKPLKNLTISNNLGTDFFYDNSRRVWANNTLGEFTKGRFVTYDWNSSMINNDLIATYDYNINDDFSLKVIGGHNILQNSTQLTSIVASNLLVPEIYSYANAETTSPSNSKSKRRLVGVYGDVTLNFRNYAFLEVTGRNDWSSTLPINERSYFYPSISGTLVFTELLPKNDALDFGKVRVNYAMVGSDTDPYQLDYEYSPVNSYYIQYLGSSAGTFPHGGLLGYSRPSTYPNAALKPQKQKAFEIGADLRFFGGRVGLDFTYYANKTTDNIVSIDVANSTGYFYAKKNAGTITNKGIEAILKLVPVEGKFTWDIAFNFAANTQKVTELDPSVQAMTLSSGYNGLQVKAAVGEAFSLYGAAFARDDNGNYIIDKNGYRTTVANQNLGKITPDFTLGINNHFSYKDFSLSFLIDIKEGGVMYSGTTASLRTSGLAHETLLNDRNPIVDAGVVLQSDGSYLPNTKEISAYNYWTQNYKTANSEANIIDASYIKLREITFGYALPKSLLKNFFIKNIYLGFEARNIWVIKSDADHIDPELNFLPSGEVGSNIEFNSIPSTRSFGFNLKFDI